ncbi:MAG: putative protease [Parcubacteria group bacterium Athens0714_16]|nr:MAG: putative protease [Parcubacteria group bacterium Athens0714_16]
MEKEIGVITHWFDKINVAVIKLNGSLKKGDKIKIMKGDIEFEETIDSMQIDHKDVNSAKKGDDVAIKLSEETKEGAIVYLVK